MDRECGQGVFTGCVDSGCGAVGRGCAQGVCTGAVRVWSGCVDRRCGGVGRGCEGGGGQVVCGQGGAVYGITRIEYVKQSHSARNLLNLKHHNIRVPAPSGLPAPSGYLHQSCCAGAAELRLQW